MKKIRVNAYQVALLLERGVYRRMLKEGVYWLWPSEKAELYDTTQPFHPTMELNILLEDEALAKALHVVEVKDNEIVLQYENGLLKQVLTAGRYTFWKSVIVYNFIYADTSKIEITENIDRSVLMNKLLAPFVRSVTVENYEKAVLFVDGKYAGILESGV